MSEDVTIHKFFDDPMLLELARQAHLYYYDYDYDYYDYSLIILSNIYSLKYSPMNPCSSSSPTRAARLFIYPLTFIHLSIYSFVHLFIYPFIHLFIYPVILLYWGYPYPVILFDCLYDTISAWLYSLSNSSMISFASSSPARRIYYISSSSSSSSRSLLPTH